MSQSTLNFDLKMNIVKEKHAMLSNIMRETNISCWIIFIRETSANPDPVQNLVIGGDVVWESAFIFSLTDKLRKTAIVGNFDANAELGKGIWDEVIPYREGISEVLKKYIAKLNVDTIAINFSESEVMADGLSHGMFLKLSKILPDKTFISATSIIQKLRSKKSYTELNLIEEAARITEKINNKLYKKFKPNMSEIEIQQMYFEEMDRIGVVEAWQRESCPAIDAGPDKVMGHSGPTELLTKKGHTLHNDFGIKYKGYCSDIQRMWFFGDNIPDELQHAFDTIKNAIKKAADFIKPGVQGWEVDKIARDYIVSRGYEGYGHALGHQVGTQAHDGGTLLGPKWERYGDLPDGIVEEGNVFTLEPHVKTKNYGMVALEEMIVVTSDGCKFIIPPQTELIKIL